MKRSPKVCKQSTTGMAPRCTHDECWFIYWMNWPGHPRLIMGAIGKFGREALIREYGTNYIKRVERFMEGRTRGIK